VRERAPDEDIETVGGDFLEVTVDGTFDTILAHSVVHYLEDESELFRFVDKATSLLNSGGTLLVGDVPNESKKERFLGTPYGEAYAFQDEWERRTEQVADSQTVSDFYPDDCDPVDIDDDLITRLLQRTRDGEFESYLARQPPSLPFNHTREDILVERRPEPP